MSSEILYTFHGSPGSDDDFSLLKQHLEGCSWVAHNPISDLTLQPPYFLVAYSFGNFKALQFLKEHLQRERNLPKAIFAVAPYFKTKKPSALAEMVLNSTPGGLLFSLLAPRLINQFIMKSSAPIQPPIEYRQQVSKLSDPHLLRKALLEKRTAQSFASLYSEVEKKKIPFYLIHGDQDSSSPLAELPAIKWADKLIIKKAGHALVWTHPKETAQQIKLWINQLSN